MEEFLTYEYSVEHSKKDRRQKRKKALLITTYMLYCAAGILFAAFSKLGVLIAPLIALVPVTCWIIAFFTWRYVNPEYRYSMTSGVLVFTVIYGGKTAKKIFETRIADAESIQPYSPNNGSDIEKYKPEKRYCGVSDFSSPDAYCMLFSDSDGKRCVYFFEATAKALKILKFYNKKTVVTTVRY